jgi:AbiTii
MDSARAAVLLDQIQVGALDSTSSLAAVLRKCVLLGGAYDSDDLVRWAKRELDGYKPEDQLPDHRVVHVPLQFDAVVGAHQVECHPLASSELPAQVRAIVSERFEVRHGIGDLEALRDRAHREGAAKLQTDAERDLAPLVSRIKRVGWNVLRVYSSVSAPALEGILSSTRNGLVESLGRLSAVQPTTGDPPTGDIGGPSGAPGEPNVTSSSAMSTRAEVAAQEAAQGTKTRTWRRIPVVGWLGKQDELRVIDWIGIGVIAAVVAALAVWFITNDPINSSQAGALVPYRYFVSIPEADVVNSHIAPSMSSTVAGTYSDGPQPLSVVCLAADRSTGSFTWAKLHDGTFIPLKALSPEVDTHRGVPPAAESPPPAAPKCSGRGYFRTTCAESLGYRRCWSRWTWNSQ